MRRSRHLVLITIMSLWPGTAFADFWCAGTPSGIFTNSNGAVIVQMPWRQDWVGICNVKTNWKGIDPSICWAWFAHLSTAVNEHKPVTVYYSDQRSCSTITTYENSPAPYYVRLDAQ
jgi:hypothetical protein